MLVFTSCVNNYLPKAIVLAQSIKKLHPDWRFCLLLGETPPASLDQNNFDQILEFDQLGIPNYPSWRFSHRLVEICTAIKGYALNYFLEKEEQEKVIYLDPDILALASLSPLEKMLDEYDLLLTPHQLAPQKDERAIQDNEICSLTHGVFNLGFVACANRGDGLDFSRFWRHRLANWCFDDKANGLFTDQKWCDLAPAYFPGLGIVRDPGYNAASWNLTDRIIAKTEAGQFTANGLPLRFYHFTGHDSGMGKIMSDIYGAHMPAVAELWKLYEAKLQAAGQAEFGRLAWSGAAFSNGTPIPDKARFHYRHTPALQTLFPDPAQTDSAGKEGFCGYWASHEAKENNPVYVWCRKPFRLLNLTRLYLARNGGIKAAPKLLAKINAIRRQEGLAGLLARIKKFKENMGVGLPVPNLNRLLQPPSQWGKWLSDAFQTGQGCLVLDHQYGGGANDYRRKRIETLLKNSQPVLLLTWDFYASKLNCEFYLPNGSTIKAEANSLNDLLKQNSLRFGQIIVNELVLWSDPTAKKDHYAALPRIWQQILKLKDRDQSRLEIAGHDFYGVCPNYNLLEAGKAYCGVSDNAQRCSECLKMSPFNTPPNFNIQTWRATWHDAYKQADEIRVFSKTSADILLKAYPDLLPKIKIKPHESLAPLEPLAPPASGPMRIGVIGHIAWHKGAGIVSELARLLDPDESLVVIGELENNKDDIRATGPYQRHELPELLKKENVSIALIPSIWPETFCYVVQECIAMQFPLVVFPLGAQAERVKDYPFGRIANNISAKAALEALRDLDKLRKAKNGIAV